MSTVDQQVQGLIGSMGVPMPHTVPPPAPMPHAVPPPAPMLPRKPLPLPASAFAPAPAPVVAPAPYDPSTNPVWQRTQQRIAAQHARTEAAAAAAIAASQIAAAAAAHVAPPPEALASSVSAARILAPASAFGPEHLASPEPEVYDTGPTHAPVVAAQLAQMQATIDDHSDALAQAETHWGWYVAGIGAAITAAIGGVWIERASNRRARAP